MDHNSAKPQRMRIDTSALSTEQIRTMAQAYLGEGFRSLPLPGAEGRYGGEGDMWVLDTLSAAVDFNINARLQRRCEKAIADTVRFRVITSGRIDGVAGGDVVSLKPGDVVIEASNISFSLDLESMGCDVVGVSAAEFGYDRIGNLDYRIIPANDPQAVMVASAMRTFFEQLDTCGKEPAEHLALLLRAMLEQLFDKYAPAGPVVSASARNVQRPMLQYIEDNIADPYLSVDHLVSAFATSRAVVYRTLDVEGGVARYIVRRRLERALSRLVFDPEDITIGQVAESLGFVDPSYFAKLFKEQFGITPSHARQEFSFDRRPLDTRTDGLLMRNLLETSEHFPRS